jgi:hypothetical protein
MHKGRPGSVEEILSGSGASARLPLRPVPMVESIRRQANQESSVFGLTRYCSLYEEPFESVIEKEEMIIPAFYPYSI